MWCKNGRPITRLLVLWDKYLESTIVEDVEGTEDIDEPLCMDIGRKCEDGRMRLVVARHVIGHG